VGADEPGGAGDDHVVTTSGWHGGEFSRA
jgi:hypothetical protein